MPHDRKNYNKMQCLILTPILPLVGPRAPVQGRDGRTAPYPSSTMSSGRLFLDRVARQHCPSPLYRHGQNNTHPLPSPTKPDISTLQRIGHFYFALTLRRYLVSSCNTDAINQIAEEVLGDVIDCRGAEALRHGQAAHSILGMRVGGLRLATGSRVRYASMPGSARVEPRALRESRTCRARLRRAAWMRSTDTRHRAACDRAGA